MVTFLRRPKIITLVEGPPRSGRVPIVAGEFGFR